jgi:cell division protein FtsB
MRWLVIGLVLLLGWLQYRLWFGDANIQQVQFLQTEIARQQEELAKLKQRNAIMEAEVRDLKSGLEAIEERARSDLGMIKGGEMFWHFTPTEPAPKR